MADWYYATVDRQQRGPVTADALRDLAETRQIDLQTLVWREGMTQWAPLGDLAIEVGLAPDGVPPLPATASTSPGRANPGNPYAAPASPTQARVAPGTPMAPIPNHLVWGILTTLLCCWPFGVVSIVYATKVESRRAEGDVEGAWDASRKARLWAMWSGGTVAIILVLGLTFAAIAEMSR